MPNGTASVYVSRAARTVFAGRPVTPLYGGVESPQFGYASRDFAPWPWPGIGGVCRPIVQCCCKGPVTIAPGEIAPIVIDWGQWLNSLQGLGYQIDSVASASLLDPTENMEPADPDVIKVVSGRNTDPDPPDNSDVAGLISLAPPYGTVALIEVAPDARIGAQYKLDICCVAHDCDGRKIRKCDCVVITVAEC